MFDPMHYSTFSGGLHFSPIIDFMMGFMKVEWGSDPIPVANQMRAMDNEDQEGAQADPDLTEFFDFTSCFFWNAGHALVSLGAESAALEVEWNVGDIVSICQAYRQTGTKCFHRVFLSNIPDYTGVLPVFTDIFPLLHESKAKVSCHLHHDILFNNPKFESYAQYLFSTTSVSSIQRAEALLGMKYLGNADDGAWQDYLWTRSPKAFKMMSKEEFCTWLQSLFLLTILPPVRTYNQNLRVHYPNSVAAFVHLRKFFVHHLKYPAHWVSCTLDEMLCTSSSQQFSTKAIIPSYDPPLPVQSKGKEQKIDISAFTLDLQTQVAISIQQQQQLSKQLFYLHWKPLCLPSPCNNTN
eukprot:Sro1677_g290560.2  (352) ;mRNA; r:9656-10711